MQLFLRGLPVKTDENKARLLQLSPCSVHQQVRGGDALKTSCVCVFSFGGAERGNLHNTFSLKNFPLLVLS